ncbi:MAG: Maf family protein [bacterium]
MKLTDLRLTLVSHSPRRRSLLAYLNLPFDVVAAESVEKWQGDSAAQVAQENAARKLQAYVPRDDRPRLYLAADTLIDVGGRLLGKPVGPDSAARMLSLLSGRRHWVVTGIALSEGPRHGICAASDETAVLFRRLTTADIRAYLRTREWQAKAGAYAIQGQAGNFVETICGSFSNVVGLPLGLLTRILQQRWGDCRFL